MKERIWLSPPHLGGSESKYLLETVAGNWIAPAGPGVTEFELKLSDYLGIPHIAALSSGTAALHLALINLGVSRNDIVLCQSLTFVATANPIVYQHAIPVFIDSEIATWNICPDALESAMKYYIRKGKKPKAVICVHLYGMPAQLDEILQICEKYEVPLIEDAAEALGSKYKDKYAGSFGKLSVISFNGNKIITTAGGGALLSNDKLLIDHARFLSTQACDKANFYQHSQNGYNYRMSSLSASIGKGQLEVIEQRVTERRANFQYYRQHLGNIPGISFQQETAGFFSNRWLTAILVDKKISGTNRETIREALEKENIESRAVWKPMHLQPVFQHAPYFGCKIAESLFETGLCLPSGSALSRRHLNKIMSCINLIFSN